MSRPLRLADVDYSTALNLIVAYAQALKHRLRFEPYTHYRDLKDLVEHLDTFAKEATKFEPNRDDDPPTFWKSWGDYLAIPMLMSNPRKTIKRAQYPLGNLPLEILNHLTVYIHSIVAGGCFKADIYQTQACEFSSSMIIVSRLMFELRSERSHDSE